MEGAPVAWVFEVVRESLQEGGGTGECRWSFYKLDLTFQWE